jgi:DNA primase
MRPSTRRARSSGLNWAKEQIVHQSEAIVCEGYTDVIGFASAGVPRAVATCGTALTEDHIRLLKRFTNRIVLAFDADAAGQNAAARVYEWEQKHEVEFAVADLPPGVDPRISPRGSVAARTAAISGASFRLPYSARSPQAMCAPGRTSPHRGGRARMVREHPATSCVTSTSWPSPTGAESMRIGCVPVAGPGRAVQHGRPVNGVAVPVDDVRPRRSQGDTAEDEALRLVVHQRDEIIDRLVPVLFASSRRRTAFELLRDEKDLTQRSVAPDSAASC